MTHPVTMGYGERNLIVTYGYGRDTLEGGTRITQLYREVDFSFDISFEVKENSEFSINTGIAFNSTDNFECFSEIPIETKTEFEVNHFIKVTRDNIYNIESKISNELAISFEITSNLSHKKLINILDLVTI